MSKSLASDVDTDVVILGGGIAGVVTLYFLLKHTNKKVVLLEGARLAHGATGHNAGQIIAEFEKPLIHLVHEHGMKKAIEGFELMEAAWELLSEIIMETDMEVPFREFIGYTGYSTFEQLLGDLETEYLKTTHGLVSFPALISRQSEWMKQVPEKYHGICTEVEDDLIVELLGITRHGYHAVIPQKKATVNSALFTESLALWCLEKYLDRASVFEGTFVHGIECATDRPCLVTDQATVVCDKIILCTNGFDNFYIRDRMGFDVDTKFHHLVEGKVGYMTGYLKEHPVDPMANSFYDERAKVGSDPFNADPSFYVTRRAFGTESDPAYLMAIGGPEAHLAEREIYFKDFEVDEKFHDDSVRFVESHFDMEGFKHSFFWHGLMGYTRTGVRLVGPEPLDDRLLYNLGCNGVGILPSIMGGRKIARHIAGEAIAETIFDPKR